MNEPESSNQKKTDLILVIDDDDNISNMLRIYLRGQGYEVVTAKSGDGKEALEKALNLPPDLVTLDPLKPGMDSFDVLAEIKKEIRAQNIPLIILRQMDERDFMESGLERVYEDYITKPFDIEELKLRIKSGIRHK